MIGNGMTEPVVHAGYPGSMRTCADVRNTVRGCSMSETVKPSFSEYCRIVGSCSSKTGDIISPFPSFSSLKDRIKTVTDPDRLRPIDEDLQIQGCSGFW